MSLNIAELWGRSMDPAGLNQRFANTPLGSVLDPAGFYSQPSQIDAPFQAVDTGFTQGGYNTLEQLQAQAAGLSPQQLEQQRQDAFMQQQEEHYAGSMHGMTDAQRMAMQRHAQRRVAAAPQQTAAQGQLASGIQQQVGAAMSAGQGARGVAPGIAQALAARQAAGVQGAGAQQQALLAAQERAAAEQQLVQAEIMQQQLQLQQNLAKTEHQRRLTAAQMAQQGAMTSGLVGGLSTIVGGIFGGPGGAKIAGEAGGLAGGQQSAAAGQLGY
jgi:hypothetical protein